MCWRRAAAKVQKNSLDKIIFLKTRAFTAHWEATESGVMQRQQIESIRSPLNRRDARRLDDQRDEEEFFLFNDVVLFVHFFSSAW